MRGNPPGHLPNPEEDINLTASGMSELTVSDEIDYFETVDDIDLGGKYYVIFEGRERGIFQNWGIVKTLTDKYPGASHKGYKTREEAEKAWKEYIHRGRQRAMTSANSGPTSRSVTGRVQPQAQCPAHHIRASAAPASQPARAQPSPARHIPPSPPRTSTERAADTSGISNLAPRAPSSSPFISQRASGSAPPQQAYTSPQTPQFNQRDPQQQLYWVLLHGNIPGVYRTAFEVDRAIGASPTPLIVLFRDALSAYRYFEQEYRSNNVHRI
ncbi:hypothetical protein JOM56_001312 [Amanita muscaria]